MESAIVRQCRQRVTTMNETRQVRMRLQQNWNLARSLRDSNMDVRIPWRGVLWVRRYYGVLGAQHGFFLYVLLGFDRKCEYSSTALG